MKIKKLKKLFDDYQNKKGIFASQYEKQIKIACELENLKFYDKENYERHMKYFFSKNGSYPNIYDQSLLKSLPEYNFLGIPIKRLIQHDCSNGYCYSMVLALSLCFNNFTIVTANLENYSKYCQNKGRNWTFNHCFLMLPNNTIIDTTFGIVCDKDIYSKIYNPQSCKYITNEDLKDNKLYQYISSLKNSTYDAIFPQLKDKPLGEAIDTNLYWDFFMDWQNKNIEYKNDENKHIEDYFTKHISRTSNPNCLWQWMLKIQYHNNQESINELTIE